MNASKSISAADLQLRKLNLIGWLAKEQDATIIKQIEELQRKRRIALYEKNLKPLPVAELRARAKRANKDIEEGRYITTEELEKELLPGNNFLCCEQTRPYRLLAKKR